MGVSVDACTVPFALHTDFGYYYESPSEDIPPVILKIFNHETEKEIGTGWEYENDEYSYGPKNHSVIVNTYTKNGAKIHAINESTTLAGVMPTFFSDKLEDLEAFMRDFGLKGEIEHNQSVIQVL